jgi:dipeptide/tripeptide permease
MNNLKLTDHKYRNEWLSFSLYAATETFEKVGSIGVAANLTVYLVKRYNVGQLTAANITNIFYGTLNFAPLLGAFISDAYLGRFRTLAYGSFFSLLVCPCHGHSSFISLI